MVKVIFTYNGKNTHCEIYGKKYHTLLFSLTQRNDCHGMWKGVFADFYKPTIFALDFEVYEVIL